MTNKVESRNILVALAWPYANGSLHLGHTASFIGSDVLARYHRLKGDLVLFVSGSDCYGTPVVLEAMAQNTSPSSIAEKYHAEFCSTFDALSFSFDWYTKTTVPEHHAVVQHVFSQLCDKKYVYSKVGKALYSPALQRFLPDRFVEGGCPHCGFDDARGDQCDQCGKLIDSLDLHNPRIHKKVFQTDPDADRSLEVRDSEHFYLSLSAFQHDLEKWVASVGDSWRPNAFRFTEGFLAQGLQDRAISRDTDWGVPIPVSGYDDKRLYVWFEAVLGYLSSSQHYMKNRGTPDDWKQWWENPDAVHYYVHGKDNVPFHSIILPATLMGAGGYHLPDMIFSSEYLSLEGEQFSTSRSHAVWVPDFLAHFDSELLRYFMVMHGPETSDVDFRWVDFGTLVNGELIGTFGNLVHRVFTFVRSNFPDGISFDSNNLDTTSKHLLHVAENVFQKIGVCIEHGRFRQGFREILAVAEQLNRFVHTREPWKHLDDTVRAHTDLSVLLHVIHALSLTIQPFLPKTSEKIQVSLGASSPILSASDSSFQRSVWCCPPVPKSFTVATAEPLFVKIDDSVIAEQEGRL